jgi:hypothetical protein
MGFCKHVQYRNSTKIPNKALRTIVNPQWYVPNKQLHTDLGISPVREEITNISHKYKVKLTAHPNELATTLLNESYGVRVSPSAFIWARIVQSVYQMATGSRLRFLTGSRIFSYPLRSDRLWGPRSLVYNGYQGRLFPGGKAAWSWCWPLSSNLCRYKENVDLYTDSSISFYGIG